MKDSFILYLEQQEVFEMLTDEEAGKLIKAIFEYEKTGQVVNLDKSLQIAFIPIRSALDRNKEKYDKVVERNRENGKKGGRPKNPVGYLGNEEKPKKADNDNEYDNDSDNDNDNVTATAVNSVNDSCVDGLQEIIDFYNNNIGFITPFGAQILTAYAEKMSKELIILAMQKAVEADKRTIQYIKGILNNWSKKGITTVIEAQKEDEEFKKNSQKSNEKNKKNAYKDYEQREYDNLDHLYAN